MRWFDWLIVILPVLGVLGTGIYSRRYLKDITAFLSAGRVCGRYVISVGDIANALSIIGLLAFVEIHYKTGFALSFWQTVTLPITVILSLFGYCTYRFRETKAQSIGQFLELRYSRRLRVFAATLRSITEMLANMIMPSLAARFFIYFLDLTKSFTLLGIQIPTFNFIMIIVLTIAVLIICLGGSLSIIVTDTIQGFICYPLMALFVVFVLYKFSWSNEILPVLSNRVAGENFLNPFDIHNLRDFNFFLVLTGVLSEKEAIGSMCLDIVLLYVGVVTLGSAFANTGAGELVGDAVAGLLGGVKNSYLLGAIFFLAAFVMTSLLYNRAVSKILIPLVILTSMSLKCDPRGLMEMCYIGSMCSVMTPMATSVVPMMMGAGGYDQKSLIKMGWLPALLMGVITVLVGMTLYPCY